jgi:hypothetical protein
VAWGGASVCSAFSDTYCLYTHGESTTWAQLKNDDSDGISPCTDGEDEAARDRESAYLADDQMYQETTEMADPRETYNPEVEWRLPMENAGHVE